MLSIHKAPNQPIFIVELEVSVSDNSTLLMVSVNKMLNQLLSIV